MSGPSPLRVQLLGGFRVSVGDREVPAEAWRRRKAAALVKLLAVTPAHRLHREQVADVLWPEHDAATVANRLHQTLHHVRRSLQPDLTPGATSPFVRLSGETLVLGLSPPWIDADAFDAAADAAVRSGSVVALNSALALYTGDLLPDDLYEDWLAAPRDRLRERRLHLLMELARRHEARGDTAAAVAALHRVVADEPTNEAAHAALMRLYAASGRHSAALNQYGHLREALRRDLGAAPDPPTQRLYEAVLAGSRAEPTFPAATMNLPTSVTSFVGRERAMDDIATLLTSTRLLTLTGPGGCGKTRLALESVAGTMTTFPGGVWFVELAPVKDPVDVPAAVAQPLGVREVPGKPLEATLCDYLRGRCALLIVDNCEHLVDSCASLADVLLRAAPDVRILATSRTALRTAGEVLWPVPPLSVPDPGSAGSAELLLEHDATRLFVERVRNQRPGFEPRADHVPVIVDICRRLDGMPLAIELAAVRARSMSLAQIAEGLEDALGLLTLGARTTAPRHQTLRGVMDWSHALLSEPERVLLRRLSVFAGGFTLEAASAMGDCPEPIGEGAPAIPSHDARHPASPSVLDTLAALVDHSLVLAEERGAEARYRLLEPVRQYAAGRLREAGEEVDARRSHLGWCLAFAEAAERRLAGAGQAAWFDRLDAELDNLRLALRWAGTDGAVESGLRLAGALLQFWSARGHLREGRDWLDTLLTHAAPGDGTPGGASVAARAKAWTAAGVLAWVQGDQARARACHEARLELSRQGGDEAGVARALYDLGNVAYYDGDRLGARWLLQQAQALRERLGDRRGVAGTLNRQGTIARDLGQLDLAFTLGAESLRLYREEEDDWGVGDGLHLLSKVALDRGDYPRAAALSEEGLDRSRRIGQRWMMAHCLNLLGAIALAEGDLAGASARCEEGLALAEKVGDFRALAMLRRTAGLAARHQGELERATRLLEASLAGEERVGDRWGIGLSHAGLGLVALGAGTWETAADHYHRSLAILGETGVRVGLADALEGMAVAALGRGVARTAARLAGAAAAYRDAAGTPLPPSQRAAFAHTVATLRSTLGVRSFGAAWAEGRRLTPEQAIQDALTVDVPLSRSRSAGSSAALLSRRERQVADLIAHDRTNREIAAELGISERTVDAHVRNILAKLGLASRTEVTLTPSENPGFSPL